MKKIRFDEIADRRFRDKAEAMLPEELRAMIGLTMERVPVGVKVTVEIDNAGSCIDARITASSPSLDLSASVFNDELWATSLVPWVGYPVRRG